MPTKVLKQAKERSRYLQFKNWWYSDPEREAWVEEALDILEQSALDFLKKNS